MKTKALFPGSFDPFTAGHLNILKRALTMFDEVVVAVGINQDKRGFFDMDKRLAIIRKATEGLSGVSVIQYDNLTIDTCHDLGIHHIVRGVRNMIDFETELHRRREPPAGAGHRDHHHPDGPGIRPHLVQRGAGHPQAPRRLFRLHP